MMRRAATALLALPALCLTAAADTVFFAQGTDSKVIAEQLAPYRSAYPDRKADYVPLVSKPANLPAARQTAQAIRAGVTALPCLVLADAQGDYAALPLATLTEETLRAAEERAKAPDRKQQFEQRRYQANQYYLFARIGLGAQKATDRELAQDIATCRSLMTAPQATQEDTQLLGLRCLYPLLMLQYTRGYKGAHTPATEAKLLEAIAALEAARDLNPDSPLGKAAHQERERLRMARRQARQAE